MHLLVGVINLGPYCFLIDPKNVSYNSGVFSGVGLVNTGVFLDTETEDGFLYGVHGYDFVCSGLMQYLGVITTTALGPSMDKGELH